LVLAWPPTPSTPASTPMPPFFSVPSVTLQPRRIRSLEFRYCLGQSLPPRSLRAVAFHDLSQRLGNECLKVHRFRRFHRFRTSRGCGLGSYFLAVEGTPACYAVAAA
jgi:hypothetical protein